MKNIIYILFIVIVVTGSCASSGDLASSREVRKSIKQENIRKAIESQQMIINVNRLQSRRGGMMEMNPELNFLIINNNRTRVSLGYVGRSYTSRPIAAINLEGEIYSRDINKKGNGSYDIRYELGQKNAKFIVNMTVSVNGYVSLRITNPRIDFVRYSGKLNIL